MTPAEKVASARALMVDAMAEYDQIMMAGHASDAIAVDAENRAQAIQNAIDYLDMGDPISPPAPAPLPR